MNRKKITAAVMLAAVLTGALAGCGKGTSDNGKMAEIFTELDTKDLEGNQVTSSIFEEKELTMVNTWATWCGPCVSELPELEELQKELQVEGTDVQIVGLVIGGEGSIKAGLSEEEVKEAKSVLKDTGVTYPQLEVSEKLANTDLKDLTGLPTTYFVDQKGRMVGEPYTGSNDKEEWKKIVHKKLGELNDGKVSEK
ncbi:MAG: redoxin domain-containing protein [Blautia sp.]